MNRKIIAGVAVGACLAVAGGGAAIAGPSSPNTASGTGGGSRTAAVPGTAAGMPVTAQTLFAVVNADGTKARSFPSSAVTTRLAAGQYQITFRQNVTGCTYLATIGNAGDGTAPIGYIATAARAGVANAVWVDTHATNGAFADRPFHLAVHC